MINLNKDSNEKHIKLLNKGNNFYLTNGEIITNIYYGEKEIYKLSPQVDDENNEITDIPQYNILYDTIYPVDVERYIFKTGKLDLIDIDSPKFDIVTAMWIYFCWYQVFGQDAAFKEEFITEEDKLNGIAEEKKAFFNYCFKEYGGEFLKYTAPYNLYKRIAIYKKNCNSKIDKFIEPLIKKMEKSKVLFNFLKGKELRNVFNNKISNYDFLKYNIVVPKKYEYTDKKLHENNFKIWIKDIYISGSGEAHDIYINLGNKGNGFNESGFKIFLLVNNYINVEMKSFQNRFRMINITPNDINDNKDIFIKTELFSNFNDVFIGIAKLENSNIEFLKLNNKNYENENLIWIN